MRHAVALAALLGSAACGKELNPKFCAAHPDDERCTGLDAGSDGETSPLPVEHLPVATELMLTSDVDITVDTTDVVIDTTAGTITPEWVGAVVLGSVAQDDGPNVMVVQVGSLTIDAAAEAIEVDGDKPLVIVARRTIIVGARINASADDRQPGPGGHDSGLGPGAGTQGGSAGQTGDGGGGGGSFGATGGRGGNPMAGMAGPTYGSALRLEGGSGGGVPSVPGSCVIEAGAGGGALQLTALESITIDDNINVGGSGGEGGEYCGTDGSGGGGGGSGGMVFLEAPMILGSGNLGALGGGGGEAANSFGADGVPGGDAGTTTAGLGGTSSNTGGDGGTASSDGTTGNQGADGSTSEGNGGGGAGGGGRIYYKTTGPQPSITALPAATDA